MAFFSYFTLNLLKLCDLFCLWPTVFKAFITYVLTKIPFLCDMICHYMASHYG